MPARNAGETSGTRNLRARPTSLEDTMYIDAGRESLNQYKHFNVHQEIFSPVRVNPYFYRYFPDVRTSDLLLSTWLV